MFSAMGMLVAGGVTKAEFVAAGFIPEAGYMTPSSLLLPENVKNGDVIITGNPFSNSDPAMPVEWMPFEAYAWMYPGSSVYWRPIIDRTKPIQFQGHPYGWHWAIYRNVLTVANVINEYQDPMAADYVDIDWPARGPGVVGLVTYMADRDEGPAQPANPNYVTRLQRLATHFTNTIADRLEVPAGAHTDRFSGFVSGYGQMARGLELRRLHGVPYDISAPPAMTGNNSPVGHQALASSVPGNAWRAFGGSSLWTPQSLPAWLQRRFPTERKATKYKIQVSSADYGPTTFSLLGSLDSVTWATLDLRVGEATWGAGEEREYDILNPGAYYYYRLEITANAAGPGRPRIEELSFTWDDGTTIPFPVDTQPDAFEFEDVSDAAVSTVYTSAPVLITGIAAPAPISVSGGEYSISSGPFTSTPGTVNNNESVRVRGVSSDGFGASVGVTLVVGGMSDTFLISTTGADLTPDAFSFAPVAGAGLSTAYESNEIAVSGINAPAPVSITGGEYSQNNGPYTAAPGTASNGDTFKVKLMSSGAFGTELSLALTIGSVTSEFTVETGGADTTPNAFTFTDVAGAATSTEYESDVVTITGINAAAAVTVSGGQYSKNGGAYTSAAGTAQAGDTFKVKRSSSPSGSTAVGVTLTVGGVSDTFTITTAAGAISAITSFAVMSATPLDATNTFGDSTERSGIDPNGWVGEATMPWQLGQTFDPTKIQIAVQDPGFDAAGSTTVTRYISGTVTLRRQWNAATQTQESNDGVTYTVYFALSDLIYAGSTIVGVEAAEGFYGSATAGSVSGPQNNSTIAYEKALPGLLNVPYERATGATYPVELEVVHARGRSGRMVARVEFIATDEHGNTSAVQTSAATALSSFQTQGNPVEVFKAAIPTANLTQADTCKIRYKVYPWLGDASAVYDSQLHGEAWPHASPQVADFPFVCDKTGAYGGAHVAVRVGASGGSVQATRELAVTTPFPTFAAAFAALPSWNNTNKGHNDHSGATVWLMETTPGAGAAHALSASFAAVAAGKALTDVRVDPDATGAVKITLTTANASDKVRFFVDIDHPSGTGFDGTATLNNKVLVLEGLDLNPTGSATVPLNYRIGQTYMRNVTIVGTPTAAQVPGGAVSTTRSCVALQLGTIDLLSTTRNNTHVPFIVAGCRFHRCVVGDLNYGSTPNWLSYDGQLVINNTFMNQQAACSAGGTQGPSIVRGIGWVGNVFERAVTASNPSVQIGADGQIKPIANLVFAYNTAPGGSDQITRVNLLYTDAAGAAGIQKTGVARFNIFAFYNVKSDWFAGAATTGRVGNWAFRHTVGHAGNVVINGDSNGNTAAGKSATNWLGERWPAGSKAGAAAITFVDDKTGTAKTGSGDYHLTGGANDAYDRVPAGEAMLSFDLDGNPRPNDGTGSAGAYQEAA